jgi:aquaporin Z
MVMGIILFMGRLSGAHLNPAVSIAFALRRDFPWRRVPGYIVVQLIGATLAALVLHAVITVSAKYGANYPAPGHSDMAAFWMELLLTMGLVSVILGTASGAQNIGLFGALRRGIIALAGLWGSPISGASMNPARTFGPDLVSTTFTGCWIYVPGPSPAQSWPWASRSYCEVLEGASPVPEPLKVTCHGDIRCREVIVRIQGESGDR